MFTLKTYLAPLALVLAASPLVGQDRYTWPSRPRYDDYYQGRQYGQRYDYGPRHGYLPEYPVVQRGDLIGVHQFFQPSTGDHLLSANPQIENQYALLGYVPEGVRFYLSLTSQQGMVPLYRYVDWRGTHFYSTSRRAGSQFGGRVEGVLGYLYSERQPGTVALHAWFDPYTGQHAYTTDAEPGMEQNFEYLGVLGHTMSPRG
jgi:hypothetical protein